MDIFKKVFLLLVLNYTALVACGGGGYFNAFVKENGYDFLAPILIDIKEENPLYKLSSYGTYSYSKRKTYFNQKSKELNLKEWQNYFEDRLTLKELEELFYVEHNSLENSYNNIAKKLNNKIFEKYFNYVADQEINAKGHEEQKISSDVLIKRGEKALLNEEDKFLKLRYLFLVMRLNHYSNNYAEVLALYKKHYSSVKDVNSIVFEWIDALRAGALQHLGRDVESNMLYGEILKNNKTNAYLGYYDFKIENDKQWNALLSQVKTKEDKALFYFLRALKWEGVPLIEHRELLKTAPNSVWFERLTYMIMQDFQNRYFDKESIDKNDKYEMTNYNSYLEQKEYFFKTLKMLKEPKFFSLYSEVYLMIKEQENLEELPKKFTKLSSMANDKQKLYVDMLRYINGVRVITSTKDNANKPLFKKLAKLLKEAPPAKRESIFAYTAHYMAKLYPKNSPEEHFSKHCSVMPSVGYSYIAAYMDSIDADDFERYVEKKSRSFYEEKVFRIVMGSLAKNDVAKFLTLLYTKDANFEKANYYMSQVPKLNRKTKFNPFNVFLSGNNRKRKGKGYEQRKFVKTMLKIRKALDKDPTSAMDHYLYANGLYNSSWFGNFPMVGSVDRSVTSFSVAEGEHILKNFDIVEKEYNLALEYATKSEFKAKIAYQLLKIEYNRFIIQNEASRYGVYVAYFEPKKLVNSKKFTKAIAKYKESYSNTKYGKEIIKKCATFKYFR
jgi:hypothetical protein